VCRVRFQNRVGLPSPCAADDITATANAMNARAIFNETDGAGMLDPTADEPIRDQLNTVMWGKAQGKQP
jgi:hypothetical protein